MDVERSRVAGSHRQFEVLVVCTANLCRSPLVEALLRDTFAGDHAGWWFRSAGTHAVDGRPAHPFTAEALSERGIALPAGWRSRRLRADDVERADLVLTASRSHRSEVVRTAPRASTRTFTLRQFLRLLDTAAVEDTGDLEPELHAHPGEALLAAALAARGMGPPAPADADDIPDPVGRPLPVFRALADRLAAEIGVLTRPVGSIHPERTASSRPDPWWALRSS